MELLIEQSRRPDITFFRDGRILMSASVTLALGLKPGDCINIAADNGEFYLFALPNPPCGRNIARVYPTKPNSNNFCANSVRLTRRLLDMLHITDTRAAFFIGKPVCISGRTLLPVITKIPLK